MTSPTRRQTLLAASTTLGAVMPLYVFVSYFTVGLQKDLQQFLGLASHPDWLPAYDVVEASLLAAISVLLGTAIFLSMSKRTQTRRLFRGTRAALPVIVFGSAVGRYLHNPSDPMPGLVAVILTILTSVAVSMWIATEA